MGNQLTAREMDSLRIGGKIWQSIRRDLTDFVRPGVTGRQIDERAEELFRAHGVSSAFHLYNNFPGNICVSVNECIIHGAANDTPIKSGDKVTLDVGFRHGEVFIDSAFTLVVDPESNPAYVEFISHGYRALWEGIRACRPGCTNGDIAAAIEGYVNSIAGDGTAISIIDGYVGHSIGRELHQKPHIFNKGLLRGQGEKMRPNMAICIEPMLLSQSSGEYGKARNGFDIISKVKGAMTCHWEHMVLFTESGIEVLTASPGELRENNFEVSE